MISLNWVKDYVDLKNEDVADLAKKVTNIGINVLDVSSNYIPNLKVGKVLKVEKHPLSDHLNICLVDLGNEKVQIVCGASNVKENIKVIVATVGAILPGNFEIKKSIIRDVESNGMICALFELGLQEKNEATKALGIHILPDTAVVGEDACLFLGCDDTILNLDLNPNRFDCNNHIPFAYEVAAALNKKVKLPDTSYREIIAQDEKFNLEIATPNCFMYNAKIVKNVKIGPSPEFIKRRLEAVGIRSINNVVDISNYVMLEYGQPLHFFDKDKLGNNIKVRMAYANEEVITLDNNKRILTPDDIVITDGDKVVCIAGVMGALNTMVDLNTSNILIESAIFNPMNVRYTSLRLDLRSEASLRYEKGLNYEYCNLALDRACHLLEKYADATIISNKYEYDNLKKEERKVNVTLAKINSILGMKLNDEDIIKSLDRLCFPYEKNNDNYLVTIPNRRVDVNPNVYDIAEEVGRVYGYDEIKPTLPVVSIKSGSYTPKLKLKKQISSYLQSLGLNEVRTYTLISEEEDKLFNYKQEDSIKLLKPMSKDKMIIRQNLLMSLFKIVNYNLSVKNKDIMIYEIANTYDKKLVEDTKIAFILCGSYVSNLWQHKDMKIDYYLTKGLVCLLLDYLGYQNRYSFKISDNLPCEIHPKVNSIILIDNEEVGYIGKVHPNYSKEDIFVGQLSLDKLLAKKVGNIKYKPLNRYPVILKDLSFIVDDNIEALDIIKVIKKEGGKLLNNVEVFDVYKGDNIEKGKKSIAFSLTFEDYNRTLTDSEVDILFNKIIDGVVKKFNAILRDN